MKLDVATSVPSLVVLAVATVLVVVRAASAPPPVAAPRATPEQSRAIALAVASEEGEWARLAIQAFPEDAWSMRDDFHARETRRVRDLAKQNDVPLEDVLRAIDDDLHRAGARFDSFDYRGARAVPCKPRPFYD